MRLTFITIIFSILASFAAHAESIRITSYNTGFLEKSGVDFVPCIAERLVPQVSLVMGFTAISPRNEPFAILLQEVWTSAAFNAYRNAAIARGLFYTPKKYSEIQKNGQMIITNMKVRETKFEPFTSESYAGRGIRTIEVQTSRGALIIANVHTSYSDANEFLPAHRAQFEQITKYFWPLSQRASLIVGGDFNAGRNMGFHQGRYNARSLIWDQALEPAFERLGMRVVGDADAVTWDEQKNLLVSDPTRVIRLTNFFAHGGPGWDQASSRLDNIFASWNMRETETGRTMLHPVKVARTCTGHTDREGRMHMSDHYGIFAKFEL
jgi:endonuclease/exonuclease/phosphatase family metal-dependent hydrolase